MSKLKEVFAPHLNRTVKMGRKRAAFAPRLHLKDYLVKEKLSAPPSSADYSAKGAGLSNIYLNDQLGDCVIAGGYHFVGTETGNAGDPFTATNSQITTDYSEACGYVPGNPATDQGCDEQQTFQYWQKSGFADGTKLLGWLAVDPTNLNEVQTALYLFENLFFGVELPDAWITPFPSANGFTWDVAGAPDPNNGHAFVCLGYNSAGVTIDTWGLLGTLTYGAIGQYCASSNNGELYVLVTPDQVGKGLSVAPNGISWSQLLADFNSLGGNVPVPIPPTPAPPTPQPPAPPTPPAPPGPPKAKTSVQIIKVKSGELKFGVVGGVSPHAGSIVVTAQYSGDKSNMPSVAQITIPAK